MPTRVPRFLPVCLLVTLLLPAAASGQDQGAEAVPATRRPQRPVPEAQSAGGDCVTFHLRVESNNTDYFYTCCDRIGGATTKTDQDIKVGAASERQCVFEIIDCNFLCLARFPRTPFIVTSRNY